MVIQRLGLNDFRRDDPFVRALVDYFSRFATECGPPPRPVRGYLAGGLGVRCYAGTRVTGDIDMFFTGGRVLIPPNTTVLVSHQGGEHSLVFDHQYTPDFGLLHPDYDQRAVGLAASNWLELLVLHPVDLAITTRSPASRTTTDPISPPSPAHAASTGSLLPGSPRRRWPTPSAT